MSFFFMLLISVNGFSQSIEDSLRGSWLCVNVTNSANKLIRGTLAGPNNYLRFSFEKRKLYVALAPFDEGTRMTVFHAPGQFTTLNSSGIRYVFQIKSFENDELVLELTNASEKVEVYHFERQDKYLKAAHETSRYRDGGTIFIQIILSKFTGLYYLQTFYLIDNKLLNRLPFPHFRSKEFETLGNYIGKNIELPPLNLKEFDKKEIEIEFVVYDLGIGNFRIVKGIDPEFDRRFAETFLATSPMWSPATADGEILDLQLAIKIEFSYTEVD